MNKEINEVDLLIRKEFFINLNKSSSVKFLALPQRMCSRQGGTANVFLKSIHNTAFVPYDLTFCVSDELPENKMFRFLFPASSPITGITWRLCRLCIVLHPSSRIRTKICYHAIRSQKWSAYITKRYSQPFLKRNFYLPRTCY